MTLRILIAALAASITLPAADPQLLNLVMPDASVLAGINVQQTLSSPWGQYLLARFQANEGDLQNLIEATGFDPRRDVSEVLVGSAALPGTHTGLVAARGIFDVQRIMGLLQSKGQQIENYNGVEVANLNQQSLAFLNSSTLVAGDAAGVRAAIDRRASSVPLDPSAVLKVNQLGSTQDAWALSLVPLSQVAPPGQAAQQGPFNMQPLQKINQASGGIKFGSMVTISAEAVAQTDADATALADVIRFLATMVQANSQNSGTVDWSAVMGNLNVSTQASVVTVSLAIPEDQFERLTPSGNHNHAGASPHPVRTNRRAR